MARFHNPYHFIPLARPRRGDRRIARDDFANAAAGCWTHDRYVLKDASGGKVRSGRIVCSLRTESAIFVGGSEREEGAQGTTPRNGTPARHEPFTVGGRPAIPESTLKGMISSIAEVASRSAVRVVSDRRMSFRRGMTGSETSGALSALGMIIRHDKLGSDVCFLLPLALPTLTTRNNDLFAVPTEYRSLFPVPAFRVYLDGYDAASESNNPRGVLANKVSFTAANRQYYYMHLADVGYVPGTFEVSENPRPLLKVKTITTGPPHNQTELHFALGQRPVDNAQLVQKRESGWTRGILRILGRHGMRPKKHELFVPVPDNLDSILEGDDSTGLIPVTAEALDRWSELAKDRYEDSEGDPERLPFIPVGYAARGTSFEPQHGDVVYFRPSPSGKSVVEISYSSIWRGRVEDGDGRAEAIWDFLDPEQLPMYYGRKTVSPAELVFGFVEGAIGTADEEAALRHKSRVRFSYAELDSTIDVNDVYEPAATLKILNTPKIPVPALRFRRRDGTNPQTLIQKAALNPGEHEPQGYVVYLHDPSAIDSASGSPNPPWRTATEGTDDFRPHLRVRIAPLRKGLTFRFHIDFTNLDEYELGMLLHAIEPDPKFHHKIGMGKPIGLGSVKLAVEGVFVVDRQARYDDEDLFDRKRYHEVWADQAVVAKSTRAQREIDNSMNANDLGAATHIRDAFTATVDGQTQRALRVLGDPTKVDYSVHYPRIAGGDPEQNLYEWFMANENGLRDGKRRIRAVGAALRPITDDTIPTLDEYQWQQN